MSWQEWLKSQQQAVSSIKKLSGLTACSHSVITESQQRYVLRTQSQRASDFAINYQQESYFVNLIAPLGFSPTPLYSDQKTLLLSWLDGEVPTEFSSKLLIQLAEIVAKLHCFEIQPLNIPKNFANSAKLNLAERCQFFWNQLSPKQQQQLKFKPPFPTIEPFKQAICHHDVHLANLIQQGEKLYLIDWEYCAISDPALELAMLISANQLSTQQQALFFEHYFVKTGFDRSACLEKVKEYLPEVEKLSQLWYAL
ncbi:LPS biosynthesis choline kinase [Pasteurellaceae bacterium LFhippo2]|nr:LPS biosynthesis choline kinase [Pasteurellaceae bacterium LFhippo2]